MFSIITGSLKRLTRDERESYKPYKYVTTQSYSLEYDDGRKIYIPSGFLTDGSSGGPDYGHAWLFHDYLYSTHCYATGEQCTRREADKLMGQILREERMNCYCWAFSKLAKFNIFWLFSRAWRTSGKRGPEFYPAYMDNSSDDEDSVLSLQSSYLSDSSRSDNKIE